MASHTLADKSSKPAPENPSLTPGPYTSQLQFEETIEAAAERIARWSGLRLQWYILTVAGVILIIFTIIYAFTSIVSSKAIEFINASYFAWAWLIALTWCSLYLLAMKRLKNRIIEDRLCLRCGEPLKEVETDEDGAGLCPGCNTIFNLNEYNPQLQTVNTLRAAKQRVHDRFPTSIEFPKPKPKPHSIKPAKIVIPIGGLYKNRSHFNNTMKKAADRLVLNSPISARIIFTIIGASIPASFIILYLLPINKGWFVLLFIGLPLVIIPLIAFILFHRVSALAKLINNKLCLSCGYSLFGLETNKFGCGKCPECGRQFHYQEYTPPPEGKENSDWQLARRIIYGHSKIYNDAEAVAAGESPFYVEFAAYPPHPPETDRLADHCQYCGYSLVGTPKSHEGIGICSECGNPFDHSLKPIPQIKSY